jgi:hypothetical protein
VALLDCFQPYFEYRMVCICGIPEITLEGMADDWRRLRDKVEALAPYGQPFQGHRFFRPAMTCEVAMCSPLL